MYKAFRRADMRNNTKRDASGGTNIGSRTLLAGEYPRELGIKYSSRGNAEEVDQVTE